MSGTLKKVAIGLFALAVASTGVGAVVAAGVAICGTITGIAAVAVTAGYLVGTAVLGGWIYKKINGDGGTCRVGFRRSEWRWPFQCCVSAWI